jgi:hypothetical protein
VPHQERSSVTTAGVGALGATGVFNVVLAFFALNVRERPGEFDRG